MKRKPIIILLAAAALAFASCGTDSKFDNTTDPTYKGGEPDSELEISQQDLDQMRADYRQADSVVHAKLLQEIALLKEEVQALKYALKHD